MQSALSEYCKIEVLTAENAYDCSACHSKTNAARCMKLQSVPRVLPIQLKRFGYTFEIENPPQNSSSSSSSLSAATETMVDLYRRSPFSSHTHPSFQQTMDHTDDSWSQDDQRRVVGVAGENDSIDVVDTDNGINNGSDSGSGSGTGIIFLHNDNETTTTKDSHNSSSSSGMGNGAGGHREVVTMKPYKLSHLVEYPKVR